jgi:predicted dehydrogenase
MSEQAPSSSPAARRTTPTGADRFTPATPARVGVVGVGRMGRHHATKYSGFDHAHLVGVVDEIEDRRLGEAERLGCEAFATETELLNAGVDAVSIAVPTTHHLKAARPFLEAGVACLIEKPLANSPDEAREIADLARTSNACLMVGHIERFNPAVQALERAQRDGMSDDGAEGLIPRFVEVHRVSPMTFRSVDVSVVMDMMIHDLDVVLWLMGGAEPVRVEAHGVPVLTEHEDVCNARLTFDTRHGKCVANITASRLAFKTERKTRITGNNGYVSIDYAQKRGVLIRKTANAIQMEEIREALRSGTDLSDLDYSELVAIEPLEMAGVDQLELELAAFLRAAGTGEPPQIDAEAGFAAVRTAQRIIEAARNDANSYPSA